MVTLMFVSSIVLLISLLIILLGCASVHVLHNLSRFQRILRDNVSSIVLLVLVRMLIILLCGVLLIVPVIVLLRLLPGLVCYIVRLISIRMLIQLHGLVNQHVLRLHLLQT